jgi:hypothetical protein
MRGVWKFIFFHKHAKNELKELKEHDEGIL